MEEDLETSCAIEFHGVAYVATVGVREQQLCVQVEVDDQIKPSTSMEFTCWTGQFPAAYIEELTRKTGNFKRFPVFVNMLLSAIARKSDAVFVDLLTTADLELYRKRKMGTVQGAMKPSDSFESGVSHANGSIVNASKRYLILTYAVEFDRVHYPLPLTLVQTPTPEILQRTIRRLRQALVIATSGGSKNHQLAEENATLKEENQYLKNTLKQYYSTDDENIDGSNIDFRVDLHQELQASIKENKELIEIYHQYREESTAEIARLKAEIKQLKVAQITSRTGTIDDQERVRFLEKTIEQERIEARQKMDESSVSLQEALSELMQMKTQLEEAQLKNRELLRQLAIARTKAGTGTSTSRPPGAANGTRYGSSARGRGSQSTYEHRDVLSAPFRHTAHDYGSSDNEDGSDTGVTGRRSTKSTHGRTFRRFDPTAYQLEKERKQRLARSTSPHGNTIVRSGRKSNPGGGYTSDSSAGGGYSSAGSTGTRNSTSSARSRGRSRVSAAHQREVDARLSSPKKVIPVSEDPPAKTPRFRAPLSRPAASRSISHRRRSSSPGKGQNNSQPPKTASRNAKGGDTEGQPSLPPPPPTSKKRLSQGTKKSTTNSLLFNTSVDSFSDIDDRLTALQQFLREARSKES